MMKRLFLPYLVALSIITFSSGCAPKHEASVHMAIEFVDHAACAYIARNEGWFEAEGLKVAAYESYTSGMALTTALGRGDINAAYVCLIPAICAYANGKVPLKVVAGTHKYGYGLLVDANRVLSVHDLERQDIRLGCPRDGSPADAVMHKMIDRYQLDENMIVDRVQRMSPPELLLALKMGHLDAVFCPEQYPSMGKELGFKILLKAKDVWPQMQGSVLIVTDELIKEHPEIVEKLVKVTEKGTRYIHEHPQDAAAIVAGELAVAETEILPLDIGNTAADLEITPAAILESLTTEMECTTSLDTAMVQEEIDYLAKLGYITSFNAEDILDLTFLEDELA